MKNRPLFENPAFDYLSGVTNLKFVRIAFCVQSNFNYFVRSIQFTFWAFAIMFDVRKFISLERKLDNKFCNK